MGYVLVKILNKNKNVREFQHLSFSIIKIHERVNMQNGMCTLFKMAWRCKRDNHNGDWWYLWSRKINVGIPGHFCSYAEFWPHIPHISQGICGCKNYYLTKKASFPRAQREAGGLNNRQKNAICKQEIRGLRWTFRLLFSYPLTYDIDDSLKSEDLKGGKKEGMIIW